MDFDGLLLTLRRRWAVAAVATLAAFLAFAVTSPSIPWKYRAECKVFCTEPLAGGFDTLKSLGVLDGLDLQNLLPLLGSREMGERVRSHLHRTGDAGGWTAEDLGKGLEVKRIGGTGYVQLTLSGARAGIFRALNVLVVIDSAPLSVSSEALSLARRVDGVILAAGRGLTRSRALLWARKAIGQAGGKVVGAVLNGGRQTRRGRKAPARPATQDRGGVCGPALAGETRSEPRWTVRWNT